MTIKHLLKKSHSLIKWAALMLAVLTFLPYAAQADTVTKAATGTDLTDGASWGGTAPTSGDIATWVSTSLGAGLTLGTPTSWDGIGVTSALSAIAITGAGPLTLGTNGIDMSSSAVNLTIVTPIELGESNQIWTINSGRTLSVTNVSGTAMNLIKNGAGTLTMTAPTNTYSGGTTVNAGTLGFKDFGFFTQLLGPGPVTINSGATLALNRTALTNSMTLNSATVTAGNSFGSTLSGPINLIGTSTINITGNLTLSGDMSGSGGLIKSGAATVPVTGTNTYAGTTTINAGTLKFKYSIYSNDVAQWTPANITVATNAALVINVGGTGEFTISQFGTLFNQLTTDVNNNGLKAGAQIGLDTNGGGASTVHTISADLADSSGLGGGPVGIKHIGAGTLELTGSNTYRGVTITDNNGTLKVSSLNSVNGGTPLLASSSLGRPTTILNGTIWLGTSTTYQGGNLTYIGTGETTDRVICLGGANGTTYRFDQSGSGLLKFTGGFTIPDNRGVKTIELKGSTAGTGEMACVIPLGQATAPNKIIKSGTNVWTLSANNLYTGTTAVNAGVLLITGSISTGTVTVASGAMLGGGGAIAGNVTYASGAKALFTPGQTLTIAGSLNVNNNVVLLNLPSNYSGGLFTLATYNTTGSSGTFSAVPVAINGTLSPQATIIMENGTVKFYAPPKGLVITLH
jgi:autotransporter-associated beta strand protein